ncbi:MAG: indolepyruvate oxidoreductase subunit beta [Bacteroidales bacterium]
MKKNIILSGVGGQGILSIATVIGEAATDAGLHLKQAEVHGMSQRGGDVQSNLRLSDDEIFSDLIPKGEADLIISMEPMEALRYVPFLSKDGCVVSSSEPLVNIPDYPSKEALLQELKVLDNVVLMDIEAIASDSNIPKSANMILLGMASRFLGILTPEQLRDAIGKIFAIKGEKIVCDNCKAFDIGLEAVKGK